jgi:putative FmdB family regulatory protein
MAVYEYRCQVCDTRFEARRPMSDASSPVECPRGHARTAKVLSMFNSPGAAGSAREEAPASAPRGGCGLGCSCAT